MRRPIANQNDVMSQAGEAAGDRGSGRPVAKDANLRHNPLHAAPVK
jgi:hypothetical protein